jgi:hypothetical protein
MKRHEPPKLPHPDFVREPSARFGWLDDRLLQEHWLQNLGPEGAAVLLFLALAADRHGASYWSRGRIANELSMDLRTLNQALHRLLELGLVAHRPWCKAHVDGVWQLLAVPTRS